MFTENKTMIWGIMSWELMFYLHLDLEQNFVGAPGVMNYKALNDESKAYKLRVFWIWINIIAMLSEVFDIFETL